MRIVASGPGFIACGPDTATQRITVKGKPVFFDFDENFGPLVTDKDGEPLKRQPTSEHDPFWLPFHAWLENYRKTHPKRQPPRDTTYDLDHSRAPKP